MMEGLESRCLLTIVWPAAPFGDGGLRATIYPNQHGVAVVRGPKISAASGFNAFRLVFDDPGPVLVEGFKFNGLSLALYSKSGQPTSMDDAPGTYAMVQGKVSLNRRMVHIGVMNAGNGSTGNYTLRVEGPPAGFLEDVPISTVNNAGASGSDISSIHDSDFYRFTLPRSGNWIVSVIPDAVKSGAALDATFNVYKAGGKPIGGSYVRTIDARGSGGVEGWRGIGMKKGASYFVQVGGAGASQGGYGLSVTIDYDLPDVSIAAVDARAGRSSGNGRFVVTRSHTDGRPMTVKYTVTGSAVAGTDFRKLSGRVTIPVNAMSAAIVLKPLFGNARSDEETVAVVLRPGPDFSILARKAVVRLDPTAGE